MEKEKIITSSKDIFWIYKMSKNLVEQFENFPEMVLTSFQNYNIKKKDIILLYQKEKIKNGFIGICRASDNQALNKNIKLFKDENLNKYMIKLNFATIFDQPIKLEKIFEFIRMDINGYKNMSSFRITYLKDMDCVTKLDYNGNKIVDKLFELTLLNNVIESVENKKKNLKKEQTKSVVNNKKTKNNVNKIVSINKKLLKKNNIKLIDDIKNSDDDTISISSSNKELELSDNLELESEKNNKGLIPILIVPCDNFKFPIKDQKKYFKNHYLNCNNCDITNNNNLELSSVIDDAYIEIVTIIDEKDPYFDPPLESYFRLENYEPMDLKSNPFIRVSYINNGNKLYDKCLLVSWIK